MTTPDISSSGSAVDEHQQALGGTAGPGYAGEWRLFCDYVAATGQPALPTTVTALTGFFAATPGRPSTTARRVRAIAAAHRRAGYLLKRPDTGPAAPPAAPARSRDASLMIAACPTRGWPDGLWGRRDAFLIVLTEHLGHPQSGARDLCADDLSVPSGDSAPLAVAGTPVSHGEDPRTCLACAVLRWLDIIGIADGLGRGSARMALSAVRAPTAASPHERPPTGPARWRGAPVLLPAIDQHGWIDDYRPMTTRAIRNRLALAAQRASHDLPEGGRDQPAQQGPPDVPSERRADAEPALDQVLTILDDLAENADALNARIQTLLASESAKWQ